MSGVADETVLRDQLVRWYRNHKRDLPWRRDVTPYRVLMSELMLQQTRVETVIPFFERFVARWPTLQAMAEAEEEDVLGAWAGLGYYRRARFLLAACRAAHQLGGLPADVDELRALPGIGDYTAGAIGSIAFGIAAPAVDGNVERVISRVDARHEDPKRARGRRAIRERVSSITTAGVASEVTQGLMELGATVCKPRQPQCERCPWSQHCVALRKGIVDELPKLAARKKPVPVEAVAGVLQRGDQLLMGKRQPGLLGGMWEPIMLEVDPAADASSAVARAFRDRAGVDVVVGPALGSVVHVFSHRKLTVQVFDVRLASDATPRPADATYAAVQFLCPDRDNLPISKLAKKIVAQTPREPLLFAAEPPLSGLA